VFVRSCSSINNKIVLKNLFHHSQLGAPQKEENPGALGTCPVCLLVKTALSWRLVCVDSRCKYRGRCRQCHRADYVSHGRHHSRRSCRARAAALRNACLRPSTLLYDSSTLSSRSGQFPGRTANSMPNIVGNRVEYSPTAACSVHAHDAASVTTTDSRSRHRTQLQMISWESCR